MKTMVTTLVLGMSLVFGVPALAESLHGGHNHDDAMNKASMPSKNATLSDGLVKKIDKAQGKITLKHGPLENMGMPGMTMVFRVQESRMLDQLKPGDTVRFRAEKIKGALMVTQLEKAK